MFRKSAPQTGDLNELIPDVVRRLLLSQEEVEARYVLKGAEAYATSNRLIVMRAGEPTVFAYDRIATTRDVSKTNTWLILGGVALFALGGTSPIFPVAGALLVLVGVLAKSRRTEIFVTGLKESLILEGAREVLGPLTQRLSEKRAKPSS
jgi:hypothetical protein